MGAVANITRRRIRHVLLLATLACGLAPAWPADVRGAQAAAGGAQAAAGNGAGETRPPASANSLRFAVIGDSGSGARAQYEVGEQLTRSLTVFPYEFVLMLGDNIYGGERPQDFVKKFEKPYQAILDRKISFYAALGNHDDPNQRFYERFGMNGQRFYSFEKHNVRFLALDSNYMDKDQQAWLEKELSGSKAKWTIAFFHHPLYSSGATHGSEVDLRAIVEPLFIKYGLDVVLAGHEHFYERLQPQKGVHYFTTGAAGKLRAGNIRPGPLTAKGFDSDYSYMLFEIDGDDLHFQSLTRRGKLIDSGTIHPSPATTSQAEKGASHE
jgi:predicted phosphodiesterase